MRSIALGAALVLAACSERASEPEVRAAARPVDVYGALYELSSDGEPLLFVSPSRWIDAADAHELAERLEAAAAADPAPLSYRARVVLQNDAWGVWARVRALRTSSDAGERVKSAAAALVQRLALAPRAPRAPYVHGVLTESEGWRDLEPELPVMSHERLFGYRRIFHVRQTERPMLSRAIYSTLVAIDASGRAYESDVVGDLEVLRFEGDRLVAARLFELDRDRLGEGGSLLEIDAAERVPSAGADDFLATFDPPAPLSTLPCARCHDDAEAMSLPSEALLVGARNAALLARVGDELEALRAAAR